MKSFIVYDSEGRILKTGHCQEEDFDLQASGSESIIEGEADFLTQYIVDGAVVDLPKKPAGEYKFDYVTKAWEFDSAAAEAKALAKRNQVLKDGPDRVNLMWWASMSPADQTAVTEYRQALLDITQQPGYPMEITWPDLPDVFK